MPADIRLSRRIFLAATGALAATTLLGCGSSGGGGTTPDDTVAWKLSGRGRRVSRAAKSHNANKVFATPAAALAGRAHPGDTSQPVPIDVTPAMWNTWFGGGAEVVDRRHL